LRSRIMKKTIALILLTLLVGCGVQSNNPFLVEWKIPFGTPPFDEIKNEHFMPAFKEAMNAHMAEIKAIVSNSEEATFKNTIAALEKSGELLERVRRVFICVNEANTNPELQAISEEVEPLLAKHNDDINLDPGLFARVKKIYRQREGLGLNEEENTLLENVWKAYINHGNNGDEFDNNAVVSRIAALRVKRSNLLGYKTHADFVLERNMAKNPGNVYEFLNDIWAPALERAKTEAAEMQAIIDREGGGFKLAGWDWWYYADKLRKEKYALDDAMLRPYFKMENVRKGAFDVAQKLYGIQFIQRYDIQTYHPDVEVFEVQEADGSHLGVFYTDYFPRDGKRAGAWSDSLRRQSNIDGRYITPLVYNIGNLSKPSTDKPSLLSIDEIQTIFHELGHALNSLFADTFNQGFRTVEYLAASFLDMDWHSLTEAKEVETASFEAKAMKKIGLMDEIASRYQSTNFGHIFDSAGYSAGYYSYI
jgi:Zn-dependent oligopeptidase